MARHLLFNCKNGGNPSRKWPPKGGSTVYYCLPMCAYSSFKGMRYTLFINRNFKEVNLPQRKKKQKLTSLRHMYCSASVMPICQTSQ